MNIMSLVEYACAKYNIHKHGNHHHKYYGPENTKIMISRPE